MSLYFKSVAVLYIAVCSFDIETGCLMQFLPGFRQMLLKISAFSAKQTWSEYKSDLAVVRATPAHIAGYDCGNGSLEILLQVTSTELKTHFYLAFAHEFGTNLEGFQASDQ